MAPGGWGCWRGWLGRCFPAPRRCEDPKPSISRDGVPPTGRANSVDPALDHFRPGRWLGEGKRKGAKLDCHKERSFSGPPSSAQKARSCLLWFLKDGVISLDQSTRTPMSKLEATQTSCTGRLAPSLPPSNPFFFPRCPSSDPHRCRMPTRQCKACCSRAGRQLDGDLATRLGRY